jgi:hypothetical protein
MELEPALQGARALFFARQPSKSHSFPSSVSDMTSATIPRLTRQRQGAGSGPHVGMPTQSRP